MDECIIVLELLSPKINGTRKINICVLIFNNMFIRNLNMCFFHSAYDFGGETKSDLSYFMGLKFHILIMIGLYFICLVIYKSNGILNLT